MAELVGREVGRYHIVEQLGQGGMATVFRGYDEMLERDVALKFIRIDIVGAAHHSEILKRFKREAKALARLSHPNIVRVHDFGEFEGAPYLVMEYCPGGTLKSRTGQPVPYQEAAKLIAPVARALQCAHAENIIHRDVKPANILLSRTGIPMLSDFGIAKILETEEVTHLTGTGMGIGTPEYMAPEQWLNQVSPQTDIYALGVVFYELVTGRKPYTADTPAAILLKQSNDPLPRPKGIVPDLPDKVEQVIFKALAKAPEQRYASMGAFAAALEDLVTWSVTDDATLPAASMAATLPMGSHAPTVPATPDLNRQNRKAIPRWGYAAGSAVALGGILLAGLALSILVGRLGLVSAPAVKTETALPAVPTAALQATGLVNLAATLPAPTSETAAPTLSAPTGAPAALPYAWTRVNNLDFVQRNMITSAVIDPEDVNVIYAGTLDSGLYKTSDRGASWAPLQDSRLGMQIRYLAIDPRNHQVVYAVTELGLVKSTDGGAGWQDKNSGLPGAPAGKPPELIIDPRDSQSLTLAFGEGAYHSTDGGESWQVVYEGSCPAMNNTLLQDPDKSETWYLVHLADDGFCQDGVYKSLDGGISWTLKKKLNSGHFDASYQEYLVAQKTKGGGVSLYTYPYNSFCDLVHDPNCSHESQDMIMSPDGGETWGDAGRACERLISNPGQDGMLGICGGGLAGFKSGVYQGVVNNANFSNQVDGLVFSPSDPGAVLY